MSLIVQKFGGTSLGSPERIRAVADRIARTCAQGHSLIVVVSAMGRATDELIELAHKVSNQPHHREMDMLLTAGERVSMALLSMALIDRNVAAQSFTGSQSGIITDHSHRRARIKRILGDRVREALAAKRVAIIAGFQGVSETKEVTTLGRGGSDTTAVALAATFKAELCEIYTDVDGVYSADPRVVTDARLWPKIRSDLMVEMAVRGAGVLHPRSVELARQKGVVLHVRNSLNDTPGTEVLRDYPMEDFDVVGVTADEDKALLTVELMRPSAITSLWDQAAECHLSIVSPFFSGGTIRFFADRDAEEEWKKRLQNLARDGFVQSFQFDPSIVPLSVIGNRFSQDGAALSQITETLAQCGISVTMGAASALAVTVAVPRTHADDGVRALHERLIAKTKV